MPEDIVGEYSNDAEDEKPTRPLPQNKRLWASLGGGLVSGADVKAKVGGTSLQVRTAINRLIEQGKVTFEGKARGTKYSVAT